jgi:M6 family metalloprotease-like protein
MADYYREQSEGVFNLRFDVYGPVKVSKNALHVDNPDDKTRNYGKEVFIEATQKVLAANPEQNYRQYDWNGDGYIEQVIYVYAGLAGNAGAATYGYIWPNTSSFTTINTPDGVIISNYSSSGELWPTSTPRSCGIGTICHEFTHCLGLPDIYPVGTDTSLPYSMVDEWDLMDGGNFTSYGWCPPNYSPLEKWLLGWKEPVELKEPASIVDMKPVAEGGNSYIIKHTDSEYLLLENRQQRGWDAGLPGKGLVVYHVNYSSGSWSANKVNSTVGKPFYQLVHADNMDYDQWVTYKTNNGWSKYKNPGYMNCRYLSSSPYPWSTDTTETVNNSLTDTSVPASLMQNKNAGGSKNLSKPITNIRMSDDGLISFDFMGGDSTLSAIRGLQMNVGSASEGIYDLRGRRLDSMPAKGVFIRRYADGTIRKCFK